MNAMNDERASDTKGGGLPHAARAAQRDMFGGEPAGARNVGPATRGTDPATSHRAATRAAHGLTLKQLAVLDAMQTRRQYVHRMGDGIAASTHEEIVASFTSYRLFTSWYPALTDSSIRTRVKELATLGYVERYDDNGVTRAGGRSMRWRLTPSGVLLDVEHALANVPKVAKVARATQTP